MTSRRPTATADGQAADIATAKRRWLEACADGSSPAQVQRLYDGYRTLVIARVAAVAAEEGAHSA